MGDQILDFESAAFALSRSWEIHRQAFGPILEPAFVENSRVRVLVINALNCISRREIRRGMALLKELGQYCVYKEDKAAWAFFVGLCFEMGGAREQMSEWYEKAGAFGHRFYLPYLKLAKAAHSDARYDEAKSYYETGIACLLESSENDRDEMILGSAYTNLTSCLTMLCQYDQAELAWREAEKYPLQPEANAVAAILYAAMGDAERVADYIGRLNETLPARVEEIRMQTRKIMGAARSDAPLEKDLSP